MAENTLVIVLAAFTLLAVMAWGGWQWRRTRIARERGETTSFAHRNERAPDR